LEPVVIRKVRQTKDHEVARLAGTRERIPDHQDKTNGVDHIG
jgi:hypothetical protein